MSEKTKELKIMIQVNDKIFINLNNVTSVIFLDDKDRVVFNFNYPITVVRDGQELQRSDYIYIDEFSNNQFYTKDSLIETLQSNNFVHISNKWINSKNIAHIKFDPQRLRVIINYASTISFKSGDSTRLTSDFIYIDAKNDDEYKKNVDIIKTYF